MESPETNNKSSPQHKPDFEDDVTAEPVSVGFLSKQNGSPSSNGDGEKKRKRSKSRSRSRSPSSHKTKKRKRSRSRSRSPSSHKSKDKDKSSPKDESRPPKKHKKHKHKKDKERRGSAEAVEVGVDASYLLSMDLSGNGDDGGSAFSGKFVGSHVLDTLEDTESKKRYRLSDGWEKEVAIRMQGAQAGKHDAYLIPPGHKKLRSNVELLKYCLKTKTAADVKCLNFEKNPGPLEEHEMTSNTRKLMMQIETLVDSNFQVDESELALLKPRKNSKAGAKAEKKQNKMQSKFGSIYPGDGFIDDRQILPKKKKKKDKEGKLKPTFAKKSTGGGIAKKSTGGSGLKVVVKAKKSTSAKPSGNNPDANFKEKQLKYLNRQFEKLQEKGQKLSTTQAEYISKQLNVNTRHVTDWWNWKENGCRARTKSPDVDLNMAPPPNDTPMGTIEINNAEETEEGGAVTADDFGDDTKAEEENKSEEEPTKNGEDED